MWFLRVVVITLCFLKCLDALKTQSLGGKWKVRDANETYSLQGRVPGGIYTDLMDAEIIGDIFYGNNDVETRWVSKTNWIYSLTFTVDDEILQYNTINLVLDGVDTYSTIFLNDVQIGETQNMFVRYIFDVKDYLKSDTNNITLYFYSPVIKSQELYDKQAVNYTIPPTCVPDDYHGECHANMIRKMQASFSWDWGPAFPSIGIWKPIYLEAYNTTAIRDVTVDIKSNDTTNSWDVSVVTYFSGNTQDDYLAGVFMVSIDTEEDTQYFITSIRLPTTEADLNHTMDFSIPKVHVNLWWPNGYGNASLYPLNVTFINQDESETVKKAVRIGFRTIELVQNELGDDGATFYFKVNDVPIFMKGTNSIPIHILPELGQNETLIRFLLQSAKDVNMNMLRVWGGGNYESNVFYEITDELGILVWQDFMFACAMYPTTDDFVKNVREEVRHQVRRLQHHSSIALWAANNENEAALRQNWYGTSSNFSLYESDFVKLYVDTIRTEALINDKSRQFLTSSPTNGIESEREGYVALNPSDSKYGDVHYYNYVVDAWDASIYPKPRFASEYGYQSLPSLQTWYSAIKDKANLSIVSDFMQSRQHHPMGYLEMTLLMEEQLNLPSETDENFIDAYIYYSQIYQAMGIKIETENYRRMRSITFDSGEGLTMGALYWQLGDVWVAPTWSSIDFQTRWKMLHYFAKDFFAPVIVTGFLNEGEIDLYLVSDLLTNTYNATLTIQVYQWSSFKAVAEENVTVDVEGGVSTNVKSIFIEEYLPEESCGSDIIKNCFFYFTISNGGLSLGPDNYVFPVALKNANISSPTITISSVTEEEENVFSVTIETDKISLFVWLETGDILGQFSENGFLQVTPTKTIYFYPRNTVTLKELQNAITVTSLMDEKYQ